MSITTSEMSPADIRACTCDNGGNGWGNGNFGDWILVFLLAGMFGGFGNGNGFFGGRSNGGAAENYVLTSDFSQLSRQIADTTAMTERKLDGISNGICSLGYDQLAQMNGINQNVSNGFYNTLNAITTNGYESRLGVNTLGYNLATQIADCCCKTQQNIKDVETQSAFNTNAITSAIKDCCCDTEKQFMQTRFDAAQYNCNTLQAIDKVGDRIIDYLCNEKTQALRDENQALRLAASQARQNELLIDRLGPKCPQAAYVVQPPQQVSFPTGCCGTANFGNTSSCGCGNF